MKAALQRWSGPETQGLLVIFAVSATWICLYAPVYADFARNAWLRPENSHAPVLLCFCIGAATVRIRYILRNSSYQSLVTVRIGEKVTGSIVFVSGLMLYAIGRIEQVELFSSVSQLSVALGMILIIGGRQLLGRLWFPVLMLVYVIIWPGWIINHMTAPLKLWISDQATALLASLGMPVAQSGVTIVAGQYKLLVADACAGLNSLVALTSLGAIYLYIAKPKVLWHSALLFLATIPIAILANFIRVIFLILITYYLGYDAGQGFLHDFAGLLMFSLALMLLICLDNSFQLIGRLHRSQLAGAAA